MSEQKNIKKAIYAFQQECPTVGKNTLNPFANYKYADYATVMEAIKPFLNKFNLGYFHAVNGENGQIAIKTTIFHIESGEEMENVVYTPVVDMAKQNYYQSLGSAVTYIKRYQIVNMLGVSVAGEDLDGFGDQLKQDLKKQPQQQPQKKYVKYESNMQNGKPILQKGTKLWENSVLKIAKDYSLMDAACKNMIISDALLSELKSDIQDKVLELQLIKEQGAK